MIYLETFRLILLVALMITPAVMARQLKRKDQTQILILNILGIGAIAGILFYFYTQTPFAVTAFLSDYLLFYIACFLPTVIAYLLKHTATWGILGLSLILASGIIVPYQTPGFAICWIAAFIWSIMAKKK